MTVPLPAREPAPWPPRGTDVALPPLGEVLARAAVVALPMRTRFRGIDVREALVLRGPHGWGEFAPFVEYDDAEAAWWLAAGLEAAWLPAPTALRDVVPVNATVPAVPPEAVPEVLARTPGARTAKVKVAERPGQQVSADRRLAEDLARVAAVREALGDGGAVRVDANGGWTPAEAATALAALREQGPLEYAEQPCADVPGLVDLRYRLAAADVDVPVAADESIRRASDPLAVVRAGAADVAVLKVPPLGGARSVLALAADLGEHGVPVVVSSALDTAVGIAAGVRAAAALPGLAHACGLATGGLLARDVAGPLRVQDGRLDVAAAATVARRPLDAAVLGGCAAPPERVRWWTERLSRAYARLAAGSAGGDRA